MPPADPSTANRLTSAAYQLTIRQSPERAKVSGQGKEKDRKPIDPPPIIQLKIRDPSDPAQNFLQSPYFFVATNLWHATEDRPAKAENDECALSGTVVSSLHRLKDSDNADGGFFVFGDVSVKCEGQYRLRFTLFEMLQGEVVSLQSIITDTFTVYSPKNFPGMSESTFLSRSFGDQGVRLRIRKETRKRPASRDAANPSDSQGYAQPRQDSGAMHAQLAYPQPSYGQPTGRDYRHEYGEPLVKRQRSVGPYDRSPHDAWAFSQGQPQASSAYPSHSLPQASSYGQVGATNAPSVDSFTFRSPMPDYNPGQASNPYDTQRSYGQEPAGQYNNSQAGSQRITQPLVVDRHAPTADHLHYQEMNRYGAVTNGDQRDQKYQYPAPPQSTYSTTENGSVLPPLSASGASAQPMVQASTSPYTYNTADGRYAAHHSSQGNVQGGRPAYPGYGARNAPF